MLLLIAPELVTQGPSQRVHLFCTVRSFLSTARGRLSRSNAFPAIRTGPPHGSVSHSDRLVLDGREFAPGCGTGIPLPRFPHLCAAPAVDTQRSPLREERPMASPASGARVFPRRDVLIDDLRLHVFLPRAARRLRVLLEQSPLSHGSANPALHRRGVSPYSLPEERTRSSFARWGERPFGHCSGARRHSNAGVRPRLATDGLSPHLRMRTRARFSIETFRGFGSPFATLPKTIGSIWAWPISSMARRCRRMAPECHVFERSR